MKTLTLALSLFGCIVCNPGTPDVAIRLPGEATPIQTEDLLTYAMHRGNPDLVIYEDGSVAVESTR